MSEDFSGRRSGARDWVGLRSACARVDGALVREGARVRDWCLQGRHWVLEKPGKALLCAIGLGCLLRSIPTGRLLAGISPIFLSLLFGLMRPLVWLLGVERLIDRVQKGVRSEGAENGDGNSKSA